MYLKYNFKYFLLTIINFYGIYNIIYGDYKKFYILVIGMSGLILSHILSTYIICILLSIFCLINIKKFIKEIYHLVTIKNPTRK